MSLMRSFNTTEKGNVNQNPIPSENLCKGKNI